jgi:hypothetical protein
MKSKAQLSALSALLLLLSATSPAFAVPVGWGAATTGSTASYCPVNGLCSTEFFGDFAYASDGGQAQTGAGSVEDTHALSRARADLSGTTNTPELKAQVLSELDNRLAGSGTGAFANAVGIQGYTYEDLDPGDNNTDGSDTIVLDLVLDVLSISDGADGRAYASAQIAVIFTSELDFSTDFATVVFEIAPSGSVRASSDKQLMVDSASSSSTLSLAFDVFDGEDFLVWAGLEAKAWRGGEADLFGTLSMSFDDPTGLSAAGLPDVGAVPLPAGVWLFLGGLGIVAGLGRYRRSFET